MESVDNIVYEIKYEEKEKFFCGNPIIELQEGYISHILHKFLIINKNKNLYDENDLESIKQYLWELNKNNKLIKTKELLCTNIPNKISVSEYLNIIGIYLSYINSIRVFKSCIPNVYFIHLIFKNVEYANVFFNTFNYSRLNFIEKEFFIYSEVIKITLGEFDDNNINCDKNLSKIIIDKTKIDKNSFYKIYEYNNKELKSIQDNNSNEKNLINSQKIHENRIMNINSLYNGKLSYF